MRVLSSRSLADLVSRFPTAMTEMITALTRRFSRRALPKRNFVYFLWRFVANGPRTYRALVNPASHGDTPAIGRELTSEGIVVGPSDRFLSMEGQRALREAACGVLQTSASEAVAATVSGRASTGDRQKEFLVDLVSYPEGMPSDDPILMVALDKKLLEIVSSYLGLWPCLHSVSAWLNYPTDSPPQTSQLWHRDPEDLRLIKAFIYLTDVDEQCGPFTYIPRTHPFGPEAASAQRLENKKRFTDDRMTRTFPPASWRVCTGGANTMILADTLGYHRGGKPTTGRRILITFTYTSGAPITDRPLSVDRMPTWVSSDIQRWAVKPLLGRPTHTSKNQKKKKKGQSKSGKARDQPVGS